MKKFNLGSKVVVSDPCYDLPTWCQAVVPDVLPGIYIADIDEHDGGDWGIRNGRLIAINEKYIDKKNMIQWEAHPATIGVDSGQCGIFDFDHFRNDNLSETYDLPLLFGEDWSRKDGDNWYQRMCNLTKDNERWGTFSHGANSSSGYGDGSYLLEIGKVGDYVVAFDIDFIGEEMEEEDED